MAFEIRLFLFFKFSKIPGLVRFCLQDYHSFAESCPEIIKTALPAAMI